MNRRLTIVMLLAACSAVVVAQPGTPPTTDARQHDAPSAPAARAERAAVARTLPAQPGVTDAAQPLEAGAAAPSPGPSIAEWTVLPGTRLPDAEPRSDGAATAASADGAFDGPEGCVDCGAGDTPEGEPVCADGYVDNYNGGCNSTPNVFGHVECGERICGHYGTFIGAGGGNFRDTDWFKFTVLQMSDVTWMATGEAQTQVFIIDGSCPAVILGSGSAGPCMQASVSLNLAPGTYFAFVATTGFTGVPCGSKYRARLLVEGCCGVGCEPGDLVENEPMCGDGYVDNFNGGCNSTPNIFSFVQCGQFVCGEYGTFIGPGGANFRDTDWYSFTLTETANVTWTVTGQARTRAFILEGSCPAVSVGTATADPCLPATVTLMNLPPGTYSAFAGTDVFSGVPCGAGYRARLTVSPCCPGSCPVDAQSENEPVCGDGYVDMYNGGCNSTPHVFSNIALNSAVCGQYGTYIGPGGGNFRDTDWYTFVLPQPTTVTWRVTGTASTAAFIMTASCPTTILGSDIADPCQAAEVSVALAAGTYRVFAATSGFTGVPCGSPYVSRLIVGTCAGDLDGDGDIDTTDLNVLLSGFGCTGGGCPGDIDGDGDTDTTDLNILLSVFGTDCP